MESGGGQRVEGKETVSVGACLGWSDLSGSGKVGLRRSGSGPPQGDPAHLEEWPLLPSDGLGHAHSRKVAPPTFLKNSPAHRERPCPTRTSRPTPQTERSRPPQRTSPAHPEGLPYPLARPPL